MKKTIFLTLLLSSSIFAEDLKLAEPNSIGKIYENHNGYLISDKCDKNSYFSCDYAGSLYASFTYWQAKEDNLAFAAINDSIDDAIINSTSIYPDFDWAPGLKAGWSIGFKNGWDLGFDYIFYKNKTKTFAECGLTSTNIRLIPLFKNDDWYMSNITFANSRWKLKFHTLDMPLGYLFSVSKNLDLRIHGGLKGASIYQDNEIIYLSRLKDERAEVKMKNDAYGIGLCAGVDSKWKLTKYWNFYANLAAAIINFKFKLLYNVFTEDYLPDSYYNLTHKFWTFKPLIASDLGVSWNKSFGEKQNRYVTFKAAYDIQYFMEQNMLWRLTTRRSYIAPKAQGFFSKGDLILHGINITLLFDF